MTIPTSNLAERVLDAFPSGSYSLSALLRLMDIVETEEVPSAAVECRVQPRMLINPKFVAKHAATPEKLLMLVMHELHHVLLGHTTLFPRMTMVQNFVFDAVINGIVCRMFPRADYTALFRDFYSERNFPACLLAPPPGWPTERVRMAEGIRGLPLTHRLRAHAVHRALYSETGASYQEVYELLPKLLKQHAGHRSRKGTPNEQTDDLGDLLRDVPLLGGHGEDELQEGGIEHRSPVLFEVVRSVVEEWPQPPTPIKGRSLADLLEQSTVTAKRVPSNRARLRKLIRKIAGTSGHGRQRQLRAEPTEVSTPIPTFARRSLVLRALGQQVLLHPGKITSRRRVPAGDRVHIYVDVSGSMAGVLKALYGAILDSADLVEPVVHLFSTKIADVTLKELRVGKCSSTYGTDIGCVADHIAHHRVRRAVLITDGYVGTPRGEHHDILAKARIAVAYLGSTVHEGDLAAIARHTCNLTEGASQ